MPGNANFSTPNEFAAHVAWPRERPNPLGGAAASRDDGDIGLDLED
jgi:hypothetical protein